MNSVSADFHKTRRRDDPYVSAPTFSITNMAETTLETSYLGY